MQCKGKTRGGAGCKNKAALDGYCKVHHPDSLEKKAEETKKVKKKKGQFYEVLNTVQDACKAKGWFCRLATQDSNNYRYATAAVRRRVSDSQSSEEVTGELNITVDEGVKVSSCKTSFHGYGLQDLQNSIMDEIGELPWIESKKKKRNSPSEIEAIQKLINRFHIVATQLQRRYNSRSTIKVADEYDVQDLFHGLLKIYFDDVRPEEYSPSRGGGSSRLDFLLKREKIVIEVKMASKKLTDRKIGEQLIIDIERYREHPDCDTLICFVYDPNMQIRNPAGIEKDLTRKEGKLSVKVMVVPK